MQYIRNLDHFMVTGCNLFKIVTEHLSNIYNCQSVVVAKQSVKVNGPFREVNRHSCLLPTATCASLLHMLHNELICMKR